MHRRPAVAGQFYPGSRSSLENELERLLKLSAAPTKALGAVVPHAGYMYSGAIAGEVFGSIDVPRRCIILCPNHTGMGARAAVWEKGRWSIPTGDIPVDEELARRLLASGNDLTADVAAHTGEHSLEVQLPFLLARQPQLTIVPITVGRIPPEACLRMGEAIAATVRAEKEPILIVASTDMNHYEDDRRTRSKDALAIARVEALDPQGLIAVCAEERISMCGVIPTAIAIAACKALGATRARLIQHATSGDVTGDRDSVVGYAGFVIE
jgi:MEMO1 family protein